MILVEMLGRTKDGLPRKITVEKTADNTFELVVHKKVLGNHDKGWSDWIPNITMRVEPEDVIRFGESIVNQAEALQYQRAVKTDDSE